MTAAIIRLAEVRAARRAEAELPKPPFDATLVFRARSLSAEERSHLAAAVNFCLSRSERLSEWERDFLRSIATWPRALSDKQRQALSRILDKIERFAGRGS